MYNLIRRNSNNCFVLEQTEDKESLRLFGSCRTNVKLHVGEVHKLYPSNIGITKSRKARLGHVERAYETINVCRILAGNLKEIDETDEII